MILLAAYNGAPYIQQQIESIKVQDYDNWYILIRDDGSIDDTPKIIREISSRDDRIEILSHKREKSEMVVNNFNILMEQARLRKAEYIMFADQDDVWRLDKIRLQIKLMLELEKKYGINTPILVYSELEVVDESLSVIDSSFMNYQGIKNESHQPLNVLLVQNFVTGCASLINNRLLELATPIPDGVMMHDWWIALLAASGGQLGFIDEPTVRYRQHSDNKVGAKSLKIFLNPFRTNWPSRWKEGYKNFIGTFRQANLLKERLQAFPDLCDEKKIHLIERYCKIACQPSGFSRLFEIRSIGIFYQSKVRQLLLFLRLLLMKSQHDKLSCR